MSHRNLLKTQNLKKEVFIYDGSKGIIRRFYKLLTEFLTEKDPIKARLERLSTDPMWEGSEDAWRESMGKLKRRGVRRVRMFISDAHQGIQAAVKKEWLRASLQRCKPLNRI